MKKQARGGGIDTALLKRMLDEAKSAIDETPSLRPGARDMVATRVASMTSFQRSALAEMNSRAPAGEQAELAPIMQRCSEQCMAACQMLYGYCPHAAGIGPCPMHAGPGTDNAK